MSPRSLVSLDSSTIHRSNFCHSSQIMVFDSSSGVFSKIRSSDSDPPHQKRVNGVIVDAFPLGMVTVNNRVNIENDGHSRLEPCIGMEFDSADDAREFYTVYASSIGFRIRIGQLYRSRTDGSIASRRYVCSKEGFQLNSRSGCPAFIRVQRQVSGRWVIDQIHKDHNHELESSADCHPPILLQKTPTSKLSDEAFQRPKFKLLENVDDGNPCSSGVINVKRFKKGEEERQTRSEPYAGLVFNSADEAYHFYQSYAETAGFGIRIGQLFRSKNDGSITSRRFVCSKEGFQHPSRLGCGAYMRIKRQESGTWIVDRLEKDHNHSRELKMGILKKSVTAPRKFLDDINGGLDSLDLAEISNGILIDVNKKNNIGSNWYQLLLNYFQTRQAEDTGFFYSVQVNNGNCMNVFWTDSRCRYSCSRFGDAIVFDTSYRKSNYLVPFATFVGVNHHKQPLVLGCALIANESKESFTWLFQTWLRAMSGCHPKSIIADQDKAIQQAVAQVFPETCHRFSMWQIKEKELENFNSMPHEFKIEYERCIYQSRTTVEFSFTWDALINKYGFKDNTWLKEMYERREHWVPLYLRGTFFAGIPLDGSIDSFLGTFLNAQTPLEDFISLYEQGLERQRQEERKEDFNSFNLQTMLPSKEPIEEQCRRFYTLTMFRIFQYELVNCYRYIGTRIYEEGTISRYSVRRCGNEIEKHFVTFSSSDLSVSCSCQMFEYEGVLCRHVLRVFKVLEIREIPRPYLLQRWTRNSENCMVSGFESAAGSQELKALMLWSLREIVNKYVESGTASPEAYKLVHEILQEGARKLSWQR